MHISQDLWKHSRMPGGKFGVVGCENFRDINRGKTKTRGIETSQSFLIGTQVEILHGQPLYIWISEPGQPFRSQFVLYLPLWTGLACATRLTRSDVMLYIGWIYFYQRVRGACSGVCMVRTSLILSYAGSVLILA